MSRWTATNFGDLPASPPKPKNLKSWWAEPKLQNDRAAFQKRLVDEELERICGNPRFGGRKPTHNKFSESK